VVAQATALERRAWWAGAAWALPLLVVVPMLALASALGTHAIIFPEGAALAMGIWVVGLPGWSASRWRVAVLPAVFAAGGVGLLALGLDSAATAILAVTLALLALQALGTRLAPALSAAVLPVVFDVRAWSYPVAVLAISLVVAAGMAWRHPILAPPPADGVRRYAWRTIGGAWIVICAWILIDGELLALPSVALAPPLFVSALEWLARGPLHASEGARRLAVLSGAALAGSAAVALVPVGWIAGALAVAVTVALMRVLSTPHPPALAIALIPQILGPAPAPLSFTIAAAAGAAALYLGVFALTRAPQMARVPHESRATSPGRA
jgi:hypothetical protein